MPVIGQRTFLLNPTTDKYISLSNEEFTRKIDLTGIGNSWTKIKVAINCAIGDTGGGNLSTTQLFLGFCNETSDPYGSQACVNACGLLFGSTGGGTWTYNAGAGNPYYTIGTWKYLRRTGVTELADSISSATFVVPTNAGTLQRRGWLGVSITQTATQFTTGYWSQAAATAASDVYLDQFLYSTNQGQSGNAPPYVLETAGIGLSKALTPGAGWNTNPLNSVDIYWSNASYALEIYAIAVQITP